MGEVIRLNRSVLRGSVRVPYSKSVAHRFLIASALAGQPVQLPYINKDVSATARCLEQLSENIARGETAHKTLNVGESGSTLRFMLPIAAALGANVTFEGEGRLAKRPMKELIDALNAHGAQITAPAEGWLPLEVRGRLSGGIFRVPADVSSQFISGLLMALPLLDEDSEIQLVGKTVSQGYIDLTLDMLKNSGIIVKKLDNGYIFTSKQRYVAPRADMIEGDWSSAAAMLIAGALMGDVRVDNVNLRSVQGDKVVVKLLKEAGAKAYGEDGVGCARGELAPIEFDAENCPDLVPALSAALAFARGKSTVYGVSRLRDKESDRLAAVMDMLSRCGIATQVDGDRLVIFGGDPHSANFVSYGDHRMAMSAALIGLKIGGCSLEGADCVDKSYPNFFEDLRSVGADIERD